MRDQEKRNQLEWNTEEFFIRATIYDLQRYIQAGVDLNDYDDYYESSPLENAVRYSPSLKIIQLLVEQRPRLTGYELFDAIRRDNLEKEIIDLLLAAGADVNGTVVDEKGYRPLHEAVRENKYDLIELLMKAGADPFLERSTWDGPGAICWASTPALLKAMFRVDLISPGGVMRAKPSCKLQSGVTGLGMDPKRLRC